MASVSVPKTATVEKQFRGQYKGETIRLTLFTGHASDGYKSDFTRRPARWIVWERINPVNGKHIVNRATRFGGNRFDLGPADFARCVEQLRNAGVQEAS